MLEFLRGPGGPAQLPPCTNDHLDDVICNVAISANNAAFNFKCDETSDLWQ